ncbi:MAG: hypothetical protein EOP70_02480 [Variovorax sp.]|jgi:8-oxo-dGTP pyrophosphatase MutT (NUDIX family)|nr:MAG: hypothetical protein EOP70_02480 [Variovorax sp.]
MKSAVPTPPKTATLSAIEDADNSLATEGYDDPESSAPDELEEETGIDLSDASELDADNVPADEEIGRVVQAPD